jgi:hypothetical protein
MKLYLAIENTSTLMEGDSEVVLAVCSTPELAMSFLKDRFWFIKAKQRGPYEWFNSVDGELSVYYRVEEVELDKSRSET